MLKDWLRLTREDGTVNLPKVGVALSAGTIALAFSTQDIWDLLSNNKDIPVSEGFCTGGAPDGGDGLQIINTEDLSTYVYVPATELEQGRSSFYGMARWGRTLQIDNTVTVAGEFTGASLNHYPETHTCQLAHEPTELFLHYQFVDAVELKEEADAIVRSKGANNITQQEAIKEALGNRFPAP